MEIKAITRHDEHLWKCVADYAERCSWRDTGKYLAKRMTINDFLDWERVFVALDNDIIAGFSALSETSSLTDAEYSPYLGFIFVEEAYRGNRISEKLCKSVIDYAKAIGFDKIYLYSDLKNFYEKYGFVKIDEKIAPWGIKQTIYMYVVK